MLLLGGNGNFTPPPGLLFRILELFIIGLLLSILKPVKFSFISLKLLILIKFLSEPFSIFTSNKEGPCEFKNHYWYINSIVFFHKSHKSIR